MELIWLSSSASMMRWSMDSPWWTTSMDQRPDLARVSESSLKDSRFSQQKSNFASVLESIFEKPWGLFTRKKIKLNEGWTNTFRFVHSKLVPLFMDNLSEFFYGNPLLIPGVLVKQFPSRLIIYYVHLNKKRRSCIACGTKLFWQHDVFARKIRCVGY